MSESTFRSALMRLADEGYHVRTSRYDEAVFGSWVIELSRPPRRIVWDGKEQTLAVQSKALLRGWQDSWLSDEGQNQSIDAVLGHLATT